MFQGMQKHNLFKGMQLQNFSQATYTTNSQGFQMCFGRHTIPLSLTTSQPQVVPASLPASIYSACQAEPQVFVCPACKSVKGKDIFKLTQHFHCKPDCLRNAARVGTQPFSPALMLIKPITVQFTCSAHLSYCFCRAQSSTSMFYC